MVPFQMYEQRIIMYLPCVFLLHNLFPYIYVFSGIAIKILGMQRFINLDRYIDSMIDNPV